MCTKRAIYGYTKGFWMFDIGFILHNLLYLLPWPLGEVLPEEAYRVACYSAFSRCRSRAGKGHLRFWTRRRLSEARHEKGAV